jgi:hypothetical protein
VVAESAYLLESVAVVDVDEVHAALLGSALLARVGSC